MEHLINVFTVLSPVLVSVITAYASILVAKISKVQKALKTNHGTSGIGEAIDIIRSRVDLIASNQGDMINSLESVKFRNGELARDINEVWKILQISHPELIEEENS